MKPSSKLTGEHLTEIRQNTSWRRLFKALQIPKDPKKSKDHDWWAKSPFRPDERTASFHINDRGWYCHATGQGGGPIELVQRLHPGISCYEAGRWLLDHGVSSIVSDVRGRVESATDRPKEGAASENPQIRQDLRPQLDPEHPACAERGIPPEVLHELGAGFLDRPPRRNGRPDPLNHRIVFQIRGLSERETGELEPVILGHMGRATSAEQAERDGKWWTYAGFRKSLELYNLDRIIFDEKTADQAHDLEHVLVVEGLFDIAKLYAAGIRNVVATFGATLSPAQLRRLDLIDEMIGVNRFLFFYDRDPAGANGAQKAVNTIATSSFDLRGQVFDWNRTWESPTRGAVGIPTTISDPAEFSIEQLRWLRGRGLI